MSECDKFAFVIHPLSLEDIARKYPILRYLPPIVSQLACKYHPPKKLSTITGIRSKTGKRLEGMFIGCTLTSDMLMNGDQDAAMANIIGCCRIAEREGAKIVGLGALTSVVGDAGVTIAREVDIAVTTGNTFTVATAIQGAMRACGLLGRDVSTLSAGVVGAAGSIGKACARILAEDVADLTLIDLNGPELEAFAPQLSGKANVSISTEPNATIPEMDLLLTVTSSVTPIIEPEHLKKGAVVCDVARPRDVSGRVAKTRPDVLVIEGGVVAVPGDVEFGIDFGFPPKTAYACMSETMILALEERFEDYTIGRDLSVDKVREISALAEKHGFELAGFRSFERAVDQDTIDRVKRLSAE